MRKITVLFVLAFGLVWASNAHTALVFNADFAQDTTYDSSWPMKAGDVVTVDIYVSNVPAPGLISMGFKLTYDSEKLSVESAGVDQDNWPYPFAGGFVDLSTSGEIQMAGFRLVGLAENTIRLGTLTFRCISDGISALMLLPREKPVGEEPYEGFVLDCLGENCDPDDPSLILDGDIGAGVLLATIRAPVPGDVNGDGFVNLADGLLILKAMVHLDQGDVVHATGDVNGDGKIGLAEASYVLQRAAGLR